MPDNMHYYEKRIKFHKDNGLCMGKVQGIRWRTLVEFWILVEIDILTNAEHAKL